MWAGRNKLNMVKFPQISCI